MHVQVWPNFIDNPYPVGPQSNGECDLCGEGVDAEMGEFWNMEQEESVYAHAQCGIDAGLDLA